MKEKIKGKEAKARMKDTKIRKEGEEGKESL